jgi:hypothetical protein
MTFWDFVLAILWILFLVTALVVLLWIIGDVIRDPELSGWAKAGWLVLLLFLPFAGAVVYLVARGHGMEDRRVGTVSHDARGDGRTADAMLASGAITGSEHAALRAKAGR